jgi:L,D-transpeptidase catalytic domain
MHGLFRCDGSRWSAPSARLVALVIASSTLALLSGCGTTGATGSRAASSATVQPVRGVSAAELARLPGATTFGRLRGAPLDPDPFSPETGVVIHPTVTRTVYAYPGGRPVAVLPRSELSSPTWVPVVQSRPGWDRVLLPTRPNRSTGWIFLGGGGLQTAYSAYRIEIDVPAYRLTVLDGGRRLGSWTVGVGAPGTPTPTGRTFLLASVAPRHPTYSPLILPLGVHSRTLSSFGGGPGTVGLHGWPDPGVFGHAVSHGCVRVPSAALRVLARIPLGTPVAITS